MISEKEMEDLIIADPDKYLGEKGLKLLSRQYRIGEYIFDLLFEDRHGAKMIVEIQRGTLDRGHTYKIMDYYDEYKENNPLDFIELMVVANKITDERKKRLSSWGVSFKEMPESDFIIQNDAIKTNENEDMSNKGASPAQMTPAILKKSVYDTTQRRVNFSNMQSIIVQSAHLMKSGLDASQIAAKLNIPHEKVTRYVRFLKNNRHPSVIEFFSRQ
jgi:hypothetical protein